jgi:dTMP kinase
MTKGLFVTFEGGEGAGKSTLATRLRDAMVKDFTREVLITREPGGTTFSEELRNLLLHHTGDVTSKAELFLFLSARIQHLEELIKPAIKRGAVVLCDRFSDSSIAYQGEARGLGMDYVASCCSLATGGYTPDITFYVDIDPKLGLLRIAARRGSEVAVDRLEKEALHFHEKVRTGFQKLSIIHPDRIVTLDGTLSPDDLFQNAYTHLQKLLLL